MALAMLHQRHIVMARCLSFWCIEHAARHFVKGGIYSYDFFFALPLYRISVIRSSLLFSSVPCLEWQHAALRSSSWGLCVSGVPGLCFATILLSHFIVPLIVHRWIDAFITLYLGQNVPFSVKREVGHMKYTVLVFFGWVALIAVGKFAYAEDCETPLPSNVIRQSKQAESGNLAFLGVWGDAKWDNKLCHTLVVESVDSDGNARVVYSHGAFDAWGIKTPGFIRSKAMISNSTLVLDWSKIIFALNMY